MSHRDYSGDNHIKNAFQYVVKRLFPAGLSARCCTELQSGAITIWLSTLISKADEIKNPQISSESHCLTLLEIIIL
jgi:hypothetical protein